MTGSNGPPVELTQEEAKFVHDILERDLAQAAMVLQMVQEDKLPISAAEKAVAYTEKAKPIRAKLKECLG